MVTFKKKQDQKIKEVDKNQGYCMKLDEQMERNYNYSTQKYIYITTR